MCGIFGVSGSTPAVPLIAAGLKKLEYRGYDSSGIAVNGEKGIWLCKSAGSLSHLEKKLNQSAPPLSSVGIGHTERQPTSTPTPFCQPTACLPLRTTA